MKIAITGHTNIEKACGVELIDPTGQDYNEKAMDIVLFNIDNYIKTIPDPILISGMARGVDEMFAIYAIQNDIPLILAVPGSIKWHSTRNLSRGMRAQAIYYQDILDSSNVIEIHEISKSYGEGNHYFVNMARNQFMVDIADQVVSYKAYDSTGTDDCINRAIKLNKYKSNII